MATTMATDCFTSRAGTSPKMRKAFRWAMKRGGPRCDACGADCGSFVALLDHLQKSATLIPAHAGAKAELNAQRERIEEVVEAIRNPRRMRAA